MTQEQLDVLTELWCLTAQESLGDYEVIVFNSVSVGGLFMVSIENDSIENITLPYEIIKDHYSPKEKAKIVISLLEQIRDNGDDWLEQEKNYWQDRKENEEENNWESNRDYKD